MSAVYPQTEEYLATMAYLKVCISMRKIKVKGKVIPVL
jgi:hypothetical protein